MYINVGENDRLIIDNEEFCHCWGIVLFNIL